MGTSLIMTLKNEEATIRLTMDSIARQTKMPDEIVIVDGCSTDRTLEILRSYDSLPLKIIQERSNISSGRNLAIQNASRDIIAVTDAGCILAGDWMEKITDFDESTDVIIGGYRPLIGSLFDACQYSIMNLFKTHPMVSSRSLAFRKEVWEEAGGYPEWLNYSEDTYFHYKLLKKYRVKQRRDAIVEWEQRGSWKDVFRQFYRYMEGDGMARMHTGRHLTRIVSYSGAGLLAAMGVSNPVFLVPLGIAAAAYSFFPARNFVRLGKYPMSGRAMLIIPALLLTADAAKISGYLSGLAKDTREARAANVRK